MDTSNVKAAAISALIRMRAGEATTGEVAKLAAELLANPPPAMVAARRYLNAVGTEHEGAAAVGFLRLLCEFVERDQARAITDVAKVEEVGIASTARGDAD